MTTKICSIDGCDKKFRALDRCAFHYKRFYGSEEWYELRSSSFPSSRLSTEERFWTYVDRTEDCWVWTAETWDGYGVYQADSKRMRAHRYSWLLAEGELGSDLMLDHQCRNRACVNPKHLRPVTNKQNLENIDVYKSNKSGYRGVYWRADRGKWTARVTHNYKRHVLGMFDNAEDAAKAALDKRLELFTHNTLDR